MTLSKIAFVGLLTITTQLFSQNWVMVWNDEFSTDGVVNQDNWTHETGGGGFGNQEAQYYTDAITNSYVSEGNLVIKAKKEDFESHGYTSAKLISKNQGDWKYGKFEIRAKIPTGRGMWPAIWMLPTDNVYGGWPESGELDIMENVGFDPDVIHWNIHTKAYNHTIGTNKGASETVDAPYDDFHVYGLEWYEDSVKFFLDGEEKFTFEKEGDDYTKWPFDQEFYVILNVAVGGTWGGTEGIDDNIFPQEMLVDYVRVYENVEVANQYTLTTTTNGGGTVTGTEENGSVIYGTSVTLTAAPDSGYEFLGWEGTFDSKINPLTFDMNLPVDVKAKFGLIGNLIVNGEFTEGTNNWFTNEGGFSTISTNDDGIVINTTGDATNNWDIQVSQSAFDLEAGCSYEFTIVAESDVATQFVAGIGLNETPWTVYSSEVIFLDANTEETTILTVNLSEDKTNSRAYFDLGSTSIGKLTIKEVSLINSCIISGTKDELKTSVITAYPNPSRDLVTLSEKTDWELYNELGSLVKTGSEVIVPLENVKPGHYFLKTGSQVIKIVKE